MPFVHFLCYLEEMNEKPKNDPSSRLAARRLIPKKPDSSARIAKVIARAGFCSRREAEAYIEAARVAVNGVTLKSPATNVEPGDKITVDGVPLKARTRTRLFLFHKPRGLVTTLRDPQGRRTVFSYLQTHWSQGPRVVSIGRLDINTEGLLLLTNDGGLSRVLELPSTGWIRRYRVRANGATSQAALDALREGVTLDGVAYAGIEANLDRQQGANCWLTMALREGKNREIKRVLEHLGLKVNRLIRLSFGPFQLGEMAEGEVAEVRTRVLRDQLGPLLAQAAGVDFSSPLDPEADQGSPKRFSQSAARARKFQDISPPKPAAKAAYGTQTIESREQVKTRLKPPQRLRKHISVLRAEEQTLDGPRKRIKRRETADRAGRVIVVDELKRAGPALKAQAEKASKHPDKRRSSQAPISKSGPRGKRPPSQRRGKI